MTSQLKQSMSVPYAIATRVAVPALLIIVWWVAARSAQSIFFPDPPAVWDAMNEWAHEGLAQDVGASLKNAALGYGLAVIIAVPLGCLVGLFRPLAWFVGPIISFMRGLPPPALLSVFVLLLGFSGQMRMAIIAWAVLWPVLLNTIDGVRRVEAPYLDTADAFSLTWGRRLRSVVLPAASPYILAGMRTGLGLAMVMIVVAEMISSDSGVGHFVLTSANSFNFAAGWAGAVVMGVLGFAISSGFGLLERRWLFWQQRTPRYRKAPVRAILERITT